MSVAKFPDKQEAYAQQIAASFIKALENKDTPAYRNPWVDGIGPTPFGQYNPVTGAQYRGSNQMALTFEAMDKNYPDDRWMTYKQGASVGGQVRKGEKGTLIRYYRESTEEVENANGEKETLTSGRAYFATVFNAAQFDGLAQKPALDMTRTAIDMHKDADAIIEKSGATIIHDTRNRAYYRPSTDEIHLPPKDQFKSQGDYYGTVLHELGHWTGHPSRLNRDQKSSRDDKSMYAREELVAEISSMMMAQRIGVRTELGQHEAYVNSWIQILTDKPQEILKACTQAEKVCEHLGVHAPEHEVLEQIAQDPAKTAHIEDGKARFAKVEKRSQLLHNTQEWTPAPTQSPKAHEISQSM